MTHVELWIHIRQLWCGLIHSHAAGMLDFRLPGVVRLHCHACGFVSEGITPKESS